LSTARAKKQPAGGIQSVRGCAVNPTPEDHPPLPVQEPLTNGDRQVEAVLRAGLDEAEQLWLDDVLARHAQAGIEAEGRGERPTGPLG
jgi:hypothetical protein